MRTAQTDLGRKLNETPFIVQWFVEQGIEVWSTVEGQQKFESDADELVNLLRFWQASGESKKTSVRTKTRMGQMVKEGKFKGGVSPYGYKLVKKGRKNRRDNEVYDIEIDEAEAEIVRLIFEKYVKCLRGDSKWDVDILRELLDEARTKLASKYDELQKAQDRLDDCTQRRKEIQSQYDELVSWSQIYRSSSTEAKKMILSKLIERVEVGKGETMHKYKVNIKFRISYAQFCGLADDDDTIKL